MASEAESATHTNWRERPYSKWAFRNTDKVLDVSAGVVSTKPDAQCGDEEMFKQQVYFLVKRAVPN